MAMAMLIAMGLMAPAAGAKIVRYAGARITVPSSWPVYDLARDPGVCVRFNRHAVYLGRPSTAENCPAHAVGRTAAVLLTTETHGVRRAAGAAAAGVVPGAGQTPLPRTSVVATWTGRPDVVARALGVRSLPAAPAVAGLVVHRGRGRGRVRARAASGGVFTGLGFDACATPSLARMDAWNASPYRAVGVYLGGANMACAQPNLTAGWVSQESAAGWHLIPTYVGLQAPGNSCGCAAIAPGRASAEGTAAAGDAAAQASAVGLGPGNPIYFDMEYYPRGGVRTAMALAFLSGWTARLHALGYRSGVYGNSDSVISDLSAQIGSGYPEPDDVWMADWNGVQTADSAWIPAGAWSSARLHQYEGGHRATYGGVTMDVDGDAIGGATAGSTSAAGTGPALPDGTFVRVHRSSAVYEIAGGAPLYVTPGFVAALPTPGPTVLTLSEQQFIALRTVPSNGTVLSTPDGAVYIVAGGAPLYVSDPTVVAGLAPAVAVDAWDIVHVGARAAHLNAVPANGTFLSTADGGLYRVAGGAPVAVPGWAPAGGAVTVDSWDLANLWAPAAHLAAAPEDGTPVEGLPSRTFWLFMHGRRRLSFPTGAAVPVSDAGLAAWPAAPCAVPRLGGLTRTDAAARLRAADCRLGRVAVRRAHRRRAARVVAQGVRPRTVLAVGARVPVTLR